MRTLYRAAAVHRPADGAPAGAPAATALVVDGDTITWVGRADAVPGDCDQTVDLADAIILPGFVDAHLHVTETGLLLRGVDLQAARSVTEVLHLVRAAARTAPGRTVLGHGWDETLLAEGRPPTRAELDRAAPGTAVYLSRIDVHSAIVSTPLAQACDAATLPGWDDTGRVERDAHHAVRDATRRDLTATDRRTAQRQALTHAASRGVVAVHEMSAPHIAPDDDLRDLHALTTGPTDPGHALPQVTCYRGELVQTPDQARQVAARLGVPLAGLAGDLNADGSLGSRTAALREPYTDVPTRRGHLYLTVEQIRDHVAACTRAGLQAGFHAIGDAAVETACRGIRRAAEQVGIAAVRAAGHRLEHLECIDAEPIADLADLGVTASVQPAFDALWGGDTGLYAARLGPARALATNPLGALAAARVPLAFGSDAPVTPVDPWAAIRASMHHHVPEQRITASAAFTAHTRAGWLAAGAKDTGTLGILAPGAPASFAAWHVPGGLDPTGLPDLAPGVPLPECILTVGAGRVLYCRVPPARP